MSEAPVFTFKKRRGSSNWSVCVGDHIYIGVVTKDERWTVRGTSVSWSGHRMGRVYGPCATRKEAAALLWGQTGGAA